MFGWDSLSQVSLIPRPQVAVTGHFSTPALLVTLALPFRHLSSALNTFSSGILDSAVIRVQLSPWLPCAGGKPVLMGSNLMILSHHRVKIQKTRSSSEDAMKGNHHHPWLHRVHAHVTKAGIPLHPTVGVSEITIVILAFVPLQIPLAFFPSLCSMN